MESEPVKNENKDIYYDSCTSGKIFFLNVFTNKKW